MMPSITPVGFWPRAATLTRRLASTMTGMPARRECWTMTRPSFLTRRLLRRFLRLRHRGTRLARPFDHRLCVPIEQVALSDEPLRRRGKAAHVVSGAAVALGEGRAWIAQHHALKLRPCERMCKP